MRAVVRRIDRLEDQFGSADADQPPVRLRKLLIDYLTPVYIADRLLTDGRTGRSALGTPPISIPMPVVEALPLGLQLTAVAGDDARLLRTAVWAYTCAQN